MKGSTDLRWAVASAADNPDEYLGVPPFSNSTEYEIWAARWCATCVRDTDLDEDEGNGGCPLLAMACVGQTPPQWHRTGLSSYVCTAWTDDPARAPRTEPARVHPEQIELLPEPAHTAPQAGLVGRAWEAGVIQQVAKRRGTRELRTEGDRL